MFNVSTPREGRIRLKLKNTLGAARTVVLEPWTTEYVLGPGRTFEILAQGDLTYPLEIELFEEQVIVYSLDSEGAILTVFENGRELEPQARAEPQEPSGLLCHVGRRAAWRTSDGCRIRAGSR
jgi:hypothetical protein